MHYFFLYYRFTHLVGHSGAKVLLVVGIRFCISLVDVSHF